MVWFDPPILLPSEAAGGAWEVQVAETRMQLILAVESRDSLTHREENLATGEIPHFPDPPLADHLVQSVQTRASMSLGVPNGVLAPAASFL